MFGPSLAFTGGRFGRPCTKIGSSRHQPIHRVAAPLGPIIISFVGRGSSARHNTYNRPCGSTSKTPGEPPPGVFFAPIGNHGAGCQHRFYRFPRHETYRILLAAALRWPCGWNLALPASRKDACPVGCHSQSASSNGAACGRPLTVLDSLSMMPDWNSARISGAA